MRYLNAAVEPYAAVNPTTLHNKGKENIISAWQQDRYSNGGASGFVAGVSFDGGKSWDLSSLPFNRCVSGGLPYDRVTDPWISFAPDGTAYLSALLINKVNNTNSAIAAMTSKNGGRSWSKPVIAKADLGPSVLNDKETITADPIHSNIAYMVWTRFKFFPNNQISNPTWFAKTTDGGQTWRSKIIFRPGLDNNTVGSIIVANPKNGILHHFFILVINKNGNKTSFILMQTSKDQGETWSKARVVTPIVLPETIAGGTGQDLVGAFSYLSVDIRSSITVTFSPVINPKTGTLYITWEDARFSDGQITEVASSFSTDGGQTWSKPTRVNRSTGKPAFQPTIGLNDRGIVGISYYQFTNQAPTNSLPVHYLFKASYNGGKSYTNPAITITRPFNMLTAPFVSGGFFVGDYQGMVTIRDTFYPFFTKVNSKRETDRTNIFVSRIRLPKR
ncbi:sialidase family protein [Marininema halotolerans]|uniref:BNR/Asp-box repeat-containing protein n=1 Tax=Marininema halotolerans TaxID=1155944 RepID=A0A1I6SZ30_9BACL|nr:sialidase family protein [Marininema halotolerans]SFS82138.1 BNR/Asp-box repeat-containing protein [Marininema halotolerans]